MPKYICVSVDTVDACRWTVTEYNAATLEEAQQLILAEANECDDPDDEPSYTSWGEYVGKMMIEGIHLTVIPA